MGGLHDHVQGLTYSSPTLLVFWASGKERKVMGLNWAGGRKDLAVKHPEVKFMEREMCSPSPGSGSMGSWKS